MSRTFQHVVIETADSIAEKNLDCKVSNSDKFIQDIHYTCGISVYSVDRLLNLVCCEMKNCENI